MGKRLGKYTHDDTKCMVRVNGKTLIEYSLDALFAAGVAQVVLVVGYKGDRLKAFVRSAYPQADIRFIENPVYDKTNNIYSFWLAREEFVSDDILLLESDLIFEPSIIAELLASPHPNLAVVSKFESWMDGTVTQLDKDDEIISMIDKAHFKWGDISDYYKTVNIYKFSKEFLKSHYLPFLEAYMASQGHNEYYEQVLKVLAFLEGTNLKGFRVKGRRWYEIDDPHDLSVAETIFCGGSEKLEKMQGRYGGYWRFPALTDFCYLVNPYFPPKRMMKEIKSSFFDLMSQYPSGARVQSVLAAKSFGPAEEQVVVGNGAAELIAHLFFFIPGTVGSPVPGFNEYSARAGADRFRPFVPSRPDFAYTPEDLLAFVDREKLGVLVLVNPDNPTGHFLDREEVERLVDGTEKRGVHLVVDESFVDFAEKDRRFSLLKEDYLRSHPKLVVVKSVSKSYGVPGFRLGIAATGDEALAAKIRAALPVWNINSFGEFFLQILDKYKNDYRTACDRLVAERAALAAALSGIGGVRVYPSQANYLLLELTGPLSSRTAAERLLDEKRLFVKDLGGKKGFPAGRQFLRVAVRDGDDNARLAEGLAALMAGNKKD